MARWDAGARGNAIGFLESTLRTLSMRMSQKGHERVGASTRSPSSWRIGSVNVNVDPLPTSLSTQIRPPWSSMNFRESASPSPVLFFFQAEDGIRDRDVTGVQTCALPI